jgi:hypothetical protein
MLPRLCLFVFALTGMLQAHQVPSLTIEATFTRTGEYKLRLDLDPRAFLSDPPTALPPVNADWYLQQSPDEKAATHQQAESYLRDNLTLRFGDQTVPLPPCRIVALDGATNEPLTPDTAETHLQATAEGRIPANGAFQIDFGSRAGVSLILLNHLEDQIERSPQALFPGESSQPFPLPELPIVAAVNPIETPPSPAPASNRLWESLIAVGLIVAGALLTWRLRRR